MRARNASRPITSAHLVGILAFTLALFFIVAFASKAVDAYRLRQWRDDLQEDLAEMRRVRDGLQAEIERRESMAFVDEMLRQHGIVPAGVVRVIPVAAAPDAAGEAARPARSTAQPSIDGQRGMPDAASGSVPPSGGRGSIWGGDWFDNPNWRAWGRLIWGFDRKSDPYYTLPQ